MSLLSRLPVGGTLYAIVSMGAGSLIALAGYGVHHWHTSAVHARGAFVLDSVLTHAAALAPAQVETVTVVRTRTNTVFATTAKQAKQVDSLASRVADTVRVAFPVVDTLVVESKELAAMVPVLRDSVASERRAADVVRVTLGLIANSARDSLRLELKRPKRTWRSSTVLTLTGAVVGTAGGYLYARRH